MKSVSVDVKTVKNALAMKNVLAVAVMIANVMKLANAVAMIIIKNVIAKTRNRTRVLF
jgi:glycerol-3-phosphate dehydrogenase